MHGWGVSPRAYEPANGSTTAVRKRSRRSRVTCGMPRRWQVSRAAITAAGEQQTRSLVAGLVPGPGCRGAGGGGAEDAFAGGGVGLDPEWGGDPAGVLARRKEGDG